MDLNKIIQGDCLEVLKTLNDCCIDCCVTSPPYFGLRDYGTSEQIGLEETPELFVAAMVEVFTEVKRVLKEAGTLWLNIGDSYYTSPPGNKNNKTTDIDGVYNRRLERQLGHGESKENIYKRIKGLKQKDLIGIPWMVAFALRSSGWYLRQDIIWHKPNPMPESVTDRCTKAHEYIFLMAKSSKYYYDADAIKTKQLDSSIERVSRGWNGDGERGYPNGPQNHLKNYMGSEKAMAQTDANKRSVWTVNTRSYSEAHFATFPERLITDCIKAGCPEYVCNKCGKAQEKIIEKSFVGNGNDNAHQADKRNHLVSSGNSFYEREANREKTQKIISCKCNAGFSPGIVLDCFMGAGTTALVARKLNRNYLGIELNPDYIKIAEKRISSTIGLFQ